MFGKQYWRDPNVLTQSFKQISTASLAQQISSPNILLGLIQKLYILCFGIPEIGFQVRSIYFEKILATHLLGKKLINILDAGSGIGAYTLLLGEKFPKARVTGGDIDPYKLHASQQLAKNLYRTNVTFIKLDVTKIHKRALYDLIITIDVLEHVKKYEQALKNFSILLKKGGYLYIHVPQPNQKRLFPQLQNWHHEDHVREGIDKKTLKKQLQRLGFRILVARETYGFFGKLAWELNHIMLSRSFVLAGITFPLLYMFALLDERCHNTNGLCVAVLAQKQ